MKTIDTVGHAKWSVRDCDDPDTREIYDDFGAFASCVADKAPLIAAAPELLTRLREAEACLRWAAQEGTGRVKQEIVGGWIHHADQARAAIAKATSTEP